MKTYIKYLLLLCVVSAFNSCSDDDLVSEQFKPVFSGDEIVFGAQASTEAGNENAKASRTIYGEPTGNKIPINWCVNDLLDIYSPQAAGVQLASYRIPEALGTAGTHVPSSSSETLERVTEGGGLQWNGTQTHDFYGIYPSTSVMKEYEDRRDPAHFTIDREAKKAKGHMPMTFTAKVTKDADGLNYTVAPNMDWAFMVAKGQSSLEQYNQQHNLSLQFRPLTTVLEFDIAANTITAPSNVSGNEIVVTHLSLVSNSGNIAGDFEYDYATDQLKNVSHTTKKDQKAGTEQLAANRINMCFASATSSIKNEPVIMKEGSKLRVTYFMLSDKDIQANNLSLQIWYEYNGIVRSCTARLGVDIQVRHMYSFKNMLMPELLNLTGSNWFSSIEPNVYVNQLSLLCAGNAFSNDLSIPWSSRQQVESYENLWAHGVRGFEMVTQSCAKNNDERQRTEKAMGDQHFVCGEIEMDGTDTSGGITWTSPTFHKAFSNLAKYLVDDETYKDYNNETLILIMRYHAVDDGYNPQRYVKDLLDYLTYTTTKGIEYDNGKKKLLKPETFVKLTANSTVQDLRGKIAIIVRPGDDAYMTHNGVGLTSGIEVTDRAGANWLDKVCVIQNWGSAYDRWDTRYVHSSGSKVAREGTWAAAGEIKVEDYLWGSATSNRNFPATSADRDFLPFGNDFTPQFNFDLPVLGSDKLAYVQEWCRVIPDQLNMKAVCGYPNSNVGTQVSRDPRFDVGAERRVGGSNYYLWYKWPGSYAEKLRAIDDVLSNVVLSKGGAQTKLFINVLSGYFATPNIINSCEPFLQFFDSPTVQYEPKQQGNGGNYAALATKLNTYMFNVLSGVGTMQNGTHLQQGPWGLVVADYLGATVQNLKDAQGYDTYCSDAEIQEAVKATYNLQRMFIANNFTFPLNKAKLPEQTPSIETGTVDDFIVSE